VNRAWREFAAANGADPERVSDQANYLTVCDAVRESCETAREVGDGLRAVLRGEVGEFRFEYPCHSPEQQRWFAMRATRRSLPGGPGAVIVHTDVTERRVAGDALRAERDFVATVLETTSVLIVVLDRDGRIMRFNRACEEASGYLSDEVEGRNFWELGLVPNEELPEVRRQASDVFA
jgi:two-component system CheB/CheR fusion protein